MQRKLRAFLDAVHGSKWARIIPLGLIGVIYAVSMIIWQPANIADWFKPLFINVMAACGMYFVNRLSSGTWEFNNIGVLFFSVDVEIPKGAVSVESNGPDCAMVEIEINRVNATFLGNGEELFCGDSVETGSLAREGSAQAYLGTYRGYASLEMHCENGEWRVCGISAYLNLYTKTATELSGGGK